MAGLAADAENRAREPRFARFVLDPKVPGGTPTDQHGNPVKAGVPVALDETSFTVRACVASGRLKPYVDAAEPVEGELFAKMHCASSFPSVGLIPIGAIVRITEHVAPGLLKMAQMGHCELLHQREVPPNAVVITPPAPVKPREQVRKHRKQLEEDVLRDLVKTRVDQIIAEEERAEKAVRAHDFVQAKRAAIAHVARRRERLASEAVEAARLAKIAQDRAERASELASVVLPEPTEPPPRPGDMTGEERAEKRAAFQAGMAGALEAQRARGDAVPETSTEPSDGVGADVEEIRRKLEIARGDGS
jgi:hypothetical protein